MRAGNGTSLEARSMAELEALKTATKDELSRIDAAIAAKREVARQTLQEIDALAKARGFDARELLGVKARPMKASASATKKLHKAKKPARYRDPADPKRVWSGYGKAPAWLVKLTKGGVGREAFQIR